MPEHVAVEMTLPEPLGQYFTEINRWLIGHVGAMNESWWYGVVPAESGPPRQCVFYFNDRNHALIFKLTWAGNA